MDSSYGYFFINTINTPSLRYKSCNITHFYNVLYHND